MYYSHMSNPLDTEPLSAPPVEGPTKHLAVVLAQTGELLSEALDGIHFEALYLLGGAIPPEWARPEPGAPDPDPSPEESLSKHINDSLTPDITHVHILPLPGSRFDAPLLASKIWRPAQGSGRPALNVATQPVADTSRIVAYLKFIAGLTEIPEADRPSRELEQAPNPDYHSPNPDPDYPDPDYPDPDYPDPDYPDPDYPDSHAPPLRLPDGFVAVSESQFANLASISMVEVKVGGTVVVQWDTGQIREITGDDVPVFLSTFFREGR